MYLNCFPKIDFSDNYGQLSIYAYLDETRKDYCRHIQKLHVVFKPILYINKLGTVYLDCDEVEYKSGLKDILGNLYLVNPCEVSCRSHDFCLKHNIMAFTCLECGTIGFSRFKSKRTHDIISVDYYMSNELTFPKFKLGSVLFTIDDMVSFKIWLDYKYGANWKGMYVTGWRTNVANERVYCTGKENSKLALLMPRLLSWVWE